MDYYMYIIIIHIHIYIYNILYGLAKFTMFFWFTE